MRIDLDIQSDDEDAAKIFERLQSAAVAGGEVCLKVDNELHAHFDVRSVRRQP